MDRREGEMSKIAKNAVRAGESTGQPTVRPDRGQPRRGRAAVMHTGLPLRIPTNGLDGARLNEDGDAV